MWTPALEHYAYGWEIAASSTETLGHARMSHSGGGIEKDRAFAATASQQRGGVARGATPAEASGDQRRAALADPFAGDVHELMTGDLAKHKHRGPLSS